MSSTRRHFLAQTSLFAGAGALYAQSATTLRINSAPIAEPQIPADFIGLSYENMQLEDPTFFSPANKSLAEQFRAISPKGVLRLGGNTSEFSWWQGQSNTPPPKRHIVLKSGKRPQDTLYAITPNAIRQLNGFLEATGWNCIYGLNLGYGSPEIDLPEAKFVAQTLGPRLQYFQIGNEVDFFGMYNLREPDQWNVDSYLREWLAIANAVQKALPGARFGLPDVARDDSWLTQIAERWSGISSPPNITTLSHHHYWGGPPGNPNATIQKLLQPDPAVQHQADLSKAAAGKMHAAYRMTEGNTVFLGGKSGLSDRFAAALWAADYALQLMSLGYSGINLHGGSGHAQAVSVGGEFVGEKYMADPNEPHPKPFYTPIANEGTLAGTGVNGKLNSTYVLEPCGYGLKFASAFAGCTLASIGFDPGGVNATSYGVRTQDGKTLVALINKDLDKELPVKTSSYQIQQVLTASSADAKEAHILTGEKAMAAITKTDEGFRIPKHTAVLLTIS